MIRMKTEGRHISNQITEGVIWKQLLFFFFPILFGTFFQQLYNPTDAVIVGKFVGKEALAAVGGPAATLINLLIGFFTGLSSGATVIIAQYYGAEKVEDVKKTVHTAMALSIAGGAVIMVLGILFSAAALRAMHTPEEILLPSAVYMRVYFLGVIPSLIYNMGSGILRAVGDSKRPLYFLILSCFANILLDILFVTVLKMGVVGVAVATALSQVISALMVIMTLIRTNDSYRLFVREIRFSPVLLHNIVRIGLPAGIQSTMYSASNLIIQSSINAFGTDTIAAWTAYGKVDGIFWMIMGAYGVSITTFAGQNFGAGKYDRIKSTFRILLLVSLIYSTTVWAISMFAPQVLAGLFTNDANLMNYTCWALRIYMAMSLIFGAQIACQQTFIALGNAKTSLFLALLRKVFLLIPLIYLLPALLSDQTFAVFLAEPVADTLAVLTTCILFARYYKKVLSSPKEENAR